jgi:hypothetical protein
MRIASFAKRVCLLLCGIMALAGGVTEQTLAQSLPLPPGEIIIGPVFRRNGSSVSSITTGSGANLYIGSVPPTQSFVNSATADVVRTAVPTQFVRFLFSRRCCGSDQPKHSCGELHRRVECRPGADPGANKRRAGTAVCSGDADDRDGTRRNLYHYRCWGPNSRQFFWSTRA